MKERNPVLSVNKNELKIQNKYFSTLNKSIICAVQPLMFMSQTFERGDKRLLIQIKPLGNYAVSIQPLFLLVDCCRFSVQLGVFIHCVCIDL